jgi:hypothetical protein
MVIEMMDVLFMLSLSVFLNVIFLAFWLGTRSWNGELREQLDYTTKLFHTCLKEFYIEGAKTIKMDEKGNFTYFPKEGVPSQL